MKRITIIICLLGLVAGVRADTRLGLINKLRNRVAETDTVTSIFTNEQAADWAQQSQDKIVRMGGYLKKYTNVIANTTAKIYALPTDFKYERGVKVKTGETWVGAIPNPQLLRDTSAFNYDIWWLKPDTAKLYVRGPDLVDGDTIRVEYFGRATALSTDSTVVELSSDDQVWVIEEMIAMYEQFKRAHPVMQAIQAQTRQDMGILKQVENEQ